MAGKFSMVGGSLCLTDILAQAKLGHSAFTRGKNGKAYFNFTQFINDEPNDYGDHSSLLLNSATKEKNVEEGKIYIGRGKKLEATGGAPIEANDQEFNIDESDELPF